MKFVCCWTLIIIAVAMAVTCNTSFNCPNSDIFSFSPKSNWRQSNVGAMSEWTLDLSIDDLEKLSQAADAVISQSFSDLSPEIPLNFVDSEASTLRESSLFKNITIFLHQNILNGRGYLLVRQIPVRTWGRRKSAVAFLLFSKLMGELRPQNKQGHVLGHVVDMGLRSDDPNVRVYQTAERQTFHTDSCDVVSLLCLQPASEGGISSIVSAETIYEEMRRNRPDLLERLFIPMATDRRGEIPEGQLPYYMVPVFSLYEGNLTVMYQRQYLDSAQRFPGVPQFTALDIEALDYFDSLANDPTMQVTVQLEIGDMLIVHNHNLLHDRSAFRDHPDPSMRRHLLRAWISPPIGRPLPPAFAARFGSLAPGARGGVALDGVRPVAYWNIEIPQKR